MSALIVSTALAAFFFVEPVNAFQVSNLLTLAVFFVGGGKGRSVARGLCSCARSVRGAPRVVELPPERRDDVSRFERGALLVSAEPLLIGRVIASVMRRSRDTYPNLEIAVAVPDDPAARAR